MGSRLEKLPIAARPPLADLALCPWPVKEKLRLDPDSEIATTGVRVSLICPVSCLWARTPRGPPWCRRALLTAPPARSW